MKTTQSTARIVAIFAATVGAASAATLDLTAPNASGTLNGAFFTNTDVGSTGSGVIDPFVRLQAASGVADGYNGSARPVMSDVNTSGTFTHDLQLSSVPQVSVNGGSYYEFLLDINQNASDPLLSLDKIQIYTRPTVLGAMPNNTSDANLLANMIGSSTLRYNLDSNGDNEILLNYVLNSGSGSGDLFAYFPVSAFGNAAQTDYVYFYSMFGAKGGAYEENDGFEEWATRTPSTTTRVPDGGATLALLGLALSSLGIVRRVTSKA